MDERSLNGYLLQAFQPNKQTITPTLEFGNGCHGLSFNKRLLCCTKTPPINTGYMTVIVNTVDKQHVVTGMIETITTQIETNDPQISKTTFDRLRNSGYSEEEAKRLMASVLVHEMFMVTKHKESFDQDRYSAMMNRLPRIPQ